MAEHFETPVNKLNIFNVNYWKIPKKHCRPHKIPSRPHVPLGPRVWDHWCMHWSLLFNLLCYGAPLKMFWRTHAPYWRGRKTEVESDMKTILQRGC